MAQTDLHNPDRKVLREFGLIMAGAFGGLFGILLPWIFDGSWPLWPWPVAVLFLAMGLLLPMSLRHVFTWWMRFGHLISRVTTPLILGILFYLVITPVGLIRRIMGKDSMRRNVDNGSDSYKVESRQPEHEHMERPF